MKKNFGRLEIFILMNELIVSGLGGNNGPALQQEWQPQTGGSNSGRQTDIRMLLDKTVKTRGLEVKLGGGFGTGNIGATVARGAKAAWAQVRRITQVDQHLARDHLEATDSEHCRTASQSQSDLMIKNPLIVIWLNWI